MPTRILIVGGGGREHALAWKLAAEPGVNLVVVAPGSAAIGAEPRVRCAPGVDPLDGPALLELARHEAVELAVIGPEAPLAAGVADALRAGGVTTFGPSQAAARIESSKAFCREVAEAAGVRTAQGRAFSTLLEAETYAHRLAAGRRRRGRQGRRAGRGQGRHRVPRRRGGDRRARAIFAGGEPLDGRPLVVVEERLVGPGGERHRPVRRARPWRCRPRATTSAWRRRRGPNTGGMGAYSPLPDLAPAEVEAIVERFHRPVLAELARRGTPFIGALYAGLILTADGPVLLEFNARFGDPETQVILPRLAAPLGPWLLAAARGAGPEGAPAGPASRVCRSSRARRSGSCSPRPAIPARARPATRSRVSTRRPDGPASCSCRASAATGRRPSGPPAGASSRSSGPGRTSAAARDAAEAIAETIGFDGLQRRHDIATGRPCRVGAASMIPRYTLPEMGAIWSEEARFEAMLRVEIAVARAQVARGLVPAEALAAIEANARVDVARIAEIERTTDHDVIAFVSQVAETVGPEGRFLHLGLTSSDVVDTALALQLRDAGRRLLTDIDTLIGVVIRRARAEADTVMMGRTHSVHAEPTTFGVKLAGWAFEVDRDRRRLAAAVDDIATGKISGPVGTYSHLAPDLEAEVLGALGSTSTR